MLINLIYKLILAALVLAWAHGAVSQRIAGRVVDAATGNGVDMAAVGLLSADSLMVGCVFSGPDGSFATEVPQGKTCRWVRVTCLGYAAQTFAAAELPEVISLNESSVRIKDVRVSSNRIEERSDTLSYSVAGFSMPQDRNIADVIAKMPGMSVESDGTIKYQGQAINRFYIEGMNLMGNRYALASNNIDHRKVKRVEVLRNHQPLAVLRGRSFSDQAAVNLVLDDAAKVNAATMVEPGGGYNTGSGDVLYANRLMLMLFAKDRQNFSIYKNDNTGNDIYTEMHPLTLVDDVAATQMESDLIQAVEADGPDIDARRHTFNRSHLLAVNHLKRLQPQVTLRTQADCYHSRERFDNRYLTEYFSSDGSVATVDESNHLVNKFTRADVCLTYERNDTTIFLKNKLEATLTSADSRSLNSLGGMVTDDFTASPDARYLRNTFAMTRNKRRSSNVVSVSSSTSVNSQPQRLQTVGAGTQSTDYLSLTTVNNAYLQQKVLGFYLKYSVGLDVFYQRLDVAAAGSGVVPHQTMTRLMPHIGPSINYRRGIFRITGQANLKWMSVERTGVGRWRGPALAFVPQVGMSMRLEPSPSQTVTLSGGWVSTVPDLLGARAGRLFTSYRTAMEGPADGRKQTSGSLTVRYEYTNPIDGIFFNCRGMASRSRRITAYRMTVDSNAVCTIAKVDADYHTATYSAMARAGKSLNWWRTLLNVSGSYSCTNGKRLMNDVLTDSRTEVVTAGAEWALRPATFLAVEAKARWTGTRIEVAGIEADSHSLDYDLTLTVPIGSSWSLSGKANSYRRCNPGHTTTFVDLAARYIRTKADYELIISNIGNNDTYRTESISSDIASRSISTMRSCDVLLKINFKL